MTPMEMYQLAEGRYRELIMKSEGRTSLAENWKKEMDYWWNQLTKEERHDLIRSAKKELEDAFSEPFKL